VGRAIFDAGSWIVVYSCRCMFHVWMLLGSVLSLDWCVAWGFSFLLKTFLDVFEAHVVEVPFWHCKSKCETV